MGDIWPYGGPRRVDWNVVYNTMISLGQSGIAAARFAAIGEAESGLDLNVINDTPATGDYSVGIWQINYYDGLYAGRSAEFGTPRQLIAGGLVRQARAAISIALSQGWGAWTTYTSGAYTRYLHGAPSQPGPTVRGNPSPVPPSSTEGDSWSGKVKRSGSDWLAMAKVASQYSKAITAI